MLRALLATLALALPVNAAADTAFPVSRCINLSNALEAPREGDWGYTIERVHLQDIADAGFDTVRFPVKFSGHMRGGRIDPALLARVDQVIGWATQTGLSVILDVHHFDALMDNPDGHGATLISIWDQLAQHYRGAPQTLMFELLNEPHGALTTARAVTLYDQIIPRIRAGHPNRWIITGGGDWNALSALYDMPPPGPNEARTFHYYTPFEFTHQLAPWTDMDLPATGWGTAADRAALATDIASATRPYPVFLGEFGVYRHADPAARAAWITAVRTAAEDAGIAWCHWGLAADFRAYDAPTRTWDPNVLRALIE